MLYCDFCGAFFEEPRWHSWTETVCQIDGSPYREEWAEMLCPECGSDEICDALTCDECGDYFTPDELEDGLCEKCRKDR